MLICDVYYTQILDLLWRLAHLPQLSRQMVELALESHASILIDSSHTKETEKKTYINKCVEDIRKVRMCNVQSLGHACELEDPVCSHLYGSFLQTYECHPQFVLSLTFTCTGHKITVVKMFLKR